MHQLYSIVSKHEKSENAYSTCKLQSSFISVYWQTNKTLVWEMMDLFTLGPLNSGSLRLTPYKYILILLCWGKYRSKQICIQRVRLRLSHPIKGHSRKLVQLLSLRETLHLLSMTQNKYALCSKGSFFVWLLKLFSYTDPQNDLPGRKSSVITESNTEQSKKFCLLTFCILHYSLLSFTWVLERSWSIPGNLILLFLFEKMFLCTK